MRAKDIVIEGHIFEVNNDQGLEGARKKIDMLRKAKREIECLLEDQERELVSGLAKLYDPGYFLKVNFARLDRYLNVVKRDEV